MTTALRDAWFAVAVLIALAPAPLRAEVVYDERIENFEIGIRDGTAEDIWTAIRRYGPFIQGQHAVGSATGRLKWSDLSIARRGHDCRLERRAVSVSVVMTLPEWWRARSAPADQLDYWRCIERTVTIHEKRHAEIWRETAHAIDRALGRLDDWMPCDELRANIGATADRLYREGVSRQHGFDADDRRRQRYQQCPRPAIPAAQDAIGAPRHSPPSSLTSLTSGDPAAPARGHSAAKAKVGVSQTTARIGERDQEPNSEGLAERNPLEDLGGAAAALLAILAAVAGYAGAMAAAMALAARRARLTGRPEAD